MDHPAYVAWQRQRQQLQQQQQDMQQQRLQQELLVQEQEWLGSGQLPQEDSANF